MEPPEGQITVRLGTVLIINDDRRAGQRVSHSDIAESSINHLGHVDTEVFRCRVHPTIVPPTRCHGTGGGLFVCFLAEVREASHTSQVVKSDSLGEHGPNEWLS